MCALRAARPSSPSARSIAHHVSASICAFGSIHRLRALCEVLGLEFYVGRPRAVPGAEFDVERLALALESVSAGFPDADRRLSVHDRAQLLVAVYALLGESDAPASAARVRELIAIARRFGVADAVRD